MNLLPLLLLGLGLFWCLILWRVRVEEGRVHGHLFLAMLSAAKRLGMNEIAIVSDYRAPKGMVYVLEKQNLMDSIHLQGMAVDVALTRAMAERFFGQYENVGSYAVEMRILDSFKSHSHAVIKNLTDGEG